MRGEEDIDREGQETCEMKEMGLYLLKWEFNTDT